MATPRFPNAEPLAVGEVLHCTSETVPSYSLTCSVPDHLQRLWVKVRPLRIPRHIAGIAVCGVFTAPSPHQGEHLIVSPDLLQTKYPDSGLQPS